jgi:hypothetical protein
MRDVNDFYPGGIGRTVLVCGTAMTRLVMKTIVNDHEVADSWDEISTHNLKVGDTVRNRTVRVDFRTKTGKRVVKFYFFACEGDKWRYVGYAGPRRHKLFPREGEKDIRWIA